MRPPNFTYSLGGVPKIQILIFHYSCHRCCWPAGGGSSCGSCSLFSAANSIESLSATCTLGNPGGAQCCVPAFMVSIGKSD